jgi:hypothetical protein
MEDVEAGTPAGSVDNAVIDPYVLENDALCVTVLPSLGGKIASIQILPGQEELLQQPLRPYAPRIPYMNFDAGDASGWDECLPSVAACELETASGTISVPDHGDFWQVAWTVNSQSGDSLTLSAEGFSLPLRFRKTLRLDGNRLQVSYSVRNLGAEDVAYVWSAHPCFAVEQGDRIVLPASVTQVTVEGSSQERLGKRGTRQSWPYAESVDLSLAGSPADGVGDKLFTPAPAEGWCAIERKRLRRRITFHFDPKQLSHLGLWLCYGGWPEGQPIRQHCVALEPCTAEGDSLVPAAAEGRAKQLSPQTQDEWTLEFEVGGVS